LHQEKNNVRNIAVLVIGIILYVLIIILQGPLREVISSFIGVLTGLQVLIATMIVITNYKRGFIVSVVLCVLSMMGAVIALLRSHSIGSLPGILLPIITIITTAIILAYMNLSKAQAAELSEQYEKIMDSNRIMHEQEEALRMLAYTDRMTGIKNIQYFLEKIDELIKENAKFMVIYIDIDNFKGINDSFGPRTGDAALSTYAKRFSDFCGNKYIYARTTGDEFAFILTGEQAETETLSIIENLRKLFNEPFTVQGTQISTTASYGIATYPLDGRTSEILIDSAIMAVYNAKANGKDRPYFFSKITANQSVYVNRSVYIPESRYYPTE